MDPIQDNKSIIEKADLALSDLLSGGELLPAQAKKFIRLLIHESVVLKMATVKPMKSKTQSVEKLRFGSRVLRRGQEGTALPLADRSKPDLGKTDLNAKLFKAEVDLTDETLEDNIEQGNLKQTIMETLGDAVARDIDEILVQGDTASADPFLAQFNGMLAAATSNVVDASSALFTKSVMRAMLKAMPTEFSRDKRRLAYLTSTNAELDYRDSLSDRATALGDKTLIEAADRTRYAGIPIVDVPMMPEDLGGGSDETASILADPKNLAVGVWRKFRMETDRDITAGVWKIVVTMRMDFKYIHEPAVVKAINVGIGA